MNKELASFCPGARFVWLFLKFHWNTAMLTSVCIVTGKPVSPRGNQLWIFTGRTGAEAEAPIFWPPDSKNWLLRKDPDAGKAWKQEEKGSSEDEMVGWHHWLTGHESESAPGDSEGQRSLVWRSPCGCQESRLLDWTTQQLALAAFVLWWWSLEVATETAWPAKPKIFITALLQANLWHLF